MIGKPEFDQVTFLWCELVPESVSWLGYQLTPTFRVAACSHNQTMRWRDSVRGGLVTNRDRKSIFRSCTSWLCTSTLPLLVEVTYAKSCGALWVTETWVGMSNDACMLTQ